jgi:hypothetical protein
MFSKKWFWIKSRETKVSIHPLISKDFIYLLIKEKRTIEKEGVAGETLVSLQKRIG